jgi:hypothetical protein
MLTGREDMQADMASCEVDSRTPLERLLALLQGGHAAALADVGLTTLDAEQLASLHRLALHQAELCAARRRLLQCPTQHCAEQIAMLEHECQRWVTLAENAQYYRQHPDVMARISRRLG